MNTTETKAVKTIEDTQTPTEDTKTGTAQTAEDATSTLSTETTEAVSLDSTTPETGTTQTAEDAASGTPDKVIGPITGELEPDYLSHGYFKGEGKNKYPDPALVYQAEIIGRDFAAGGVTATAFNRLLRILKEAKGKSLEAQQGALIRLMPLVTKLELKKKAPPLLREIVECNWAAVKNEADFAVCLDHFRDIGIYLEMAQK